MRKIVLLVSIFTVMGMTVFGYLRQRSFTLSQEEQVFLNLIKARVESLRDRHFPELGRLKIQILPFQKDGDFFRSQVSSIWKNPLQRVYVIEVNPALLKNSPGGVAMDAGLTREIVHILSFFRMSSWDLMWHQIDEKEADRVVLRLIGAEGLKRYRAWHYRQLSEEQIKELKPTFLDPAEMDQYVSEITSSFSS